MKITININGTSTEITLTPEQLAQIEAQKRPKKFEWKYPRGNACLVDLTNVKYYYDGNSDNVLEHGRYRLTKEAAEQSLARNKRANRLEALAEQLGGLKEFEHGNNNFYTYRDYDVWTHAIATFCFHPEIVYMTRECAIEISRMLNEGEFSLDGEL